MLRIRRLEGHVVICGLGRKGTALAHDFHSQGVRVVVFERDGGNENIEICRARGIPVILQDASDARSLEAVRAEKARHVIAVTGDDGTNVEIAVHLYQLVSGAGERHRSLVHCWIQVVDLRLARLLERHQLLTDKADWFAARIFNPYENSSRIALRESPLDYGWIGPADPRSVRLIVVGFGQMGESLTLQAARTAHYANGKHIRITVVDREAGRKGRLFRARYPEFERIGSIQFVDGDAVEPSTLAAIENMIGRDDELATIAVCFDNDSHGLSCALDILPRIGDRSVPLLLRMADSMGLATLFEHDDQRCEWIRRIRPFGIVSRVCNRDEFLHERLDTLARALHETYVSRRLPEQSPSNKPSLEPWNRLDEAYKDSSRQLADHIPVKLRAIHCRASAQTEGREALRGFEPEEVELLARMEHSRWCAERILSGWKIGEASLERRSTPHLLEWESLDEATREIDREMVREIPDALERVGERVYRTPSDPHGAFDVKALFLEQD